MDKVERLSCLLCGNRCTYCHALDVSKGRPVVLADFHPNEKVRSQQLDINGELLTKNGYGLLNYHREHPDSLIEGHLGFGVFDRPITGATYVGNNDYHEWQILVARAAGIDGFIVEWGYNGDNTSADKAIQSFRSILNKISRNDQFAVVPNWLPNWYKAKADENLEAVYKKQLNKINNIFYTGRHAITFDKKPLIFVLDFWIKNKHLSKDDLDKLLSSDMSLANINLIWRMGTHERDRWDLTTTKQVVGNFPWLTHRGQEASSSNDHFIRFNFQQYADHNDVRKHIKKLNKLMNNHLLTHQLRVLPVTPGIDTRYAAWNSQKTVLKREENGVNTFEYSWEKILSGSYSKPDIVIVETFNDFSEGTHVEPTELGGFKDIEILGKYTCRLKLNDNIEHYYCDHEIRKAKYLSCQAMKIYEARKILNIFKIISDKNDDRAKKLQHNINFWSKAVFDRLSNRANRYRKNAYDKIQKLPIGLKKSRREINEIITSNTVLNLNDLSPSLDEKAFINTNYSLGGLQIRISEIDHKEKSKESIKIFTVNKDDSNGSLVAEIYPDDNNDIMVPLNTQNQEGVIHEKYRIEPSNHQIELRYLKIDTYYLKKTPDEKENELKYNMEFHESCFSL